MSFKKFTRAFILSALVILAFVYSSTIASARESDSTLLYKDPVFDFSLEYPSTFVLFDRSDDPNAISEVLTFQSTTTGEKIIVGHLLAEIKPETPLEEWVILYESVSTPFLESELERGNFQRILDGKSITRDGESPLGYHRNTYIVSGNVVWFIWTNEEDSNYYELFVKSFKMGSDMPRTLRDIYGEDFQPLKLDQVVKTSQQNGSKEQTSLSDSLPNYLQAKNMPSSPVMLSSSFWSPVLNTSAGPYGVTCGHSGSELYGVDAPTNNWTNVYAVNSGSVVFAGWDVNYGNYIKMLHSGSLYSYSAHLNAIYTYTGANHNRGDFIGKTGNTGNSFGPHLHFHIDNTSLVGMTGFNTSIYTYPTPSGSGAVCGLLGR